MTVAVTETVVFPVKVAPAAGVLKHRDTVYAPDDGELLWQVGAAKGAAETSELLAVNGATRSESTTKKLTNNLLLFIFTSLCTNKLPNPMLLSFY